MLDSTEYTEIEGRLYPNPQVSLDESLSFIDNLRATQAQNTQQITQDTQRLGTDISSNLGGLTGGEGYFTSRYQTPQMNATVANLRATAQAAALNQALENEQAKWKKRYQDAYRNYQKSAYNRAYGGGGSNSQNSGTTGLEVDTNAGNESEKIYLDINNPTPGTPIPLTDTSMKYQDPATGKWYVLTNPKEIDAIKVTSSLAGKNPKDGMTTTANGKVFRYVGPQDAWYEQVYMFGQG